MGWILYSRGVAILNVTGLILFVYAAFDDGLMLPARTTAEMPGPDTVLVMTFYLLANAVAAIRLMFAEGEA